jgi:hypothetical protein
LAPEVDAFRPGLLAGTIIEDVDVVEVVEGVLDDDVIVGSRLGEVENDDDGVPER